ncbi:formate dehydrogenase subunit gamma [Endozoicomonas sp. OPT23]|uniref:formate dehydrogenase subunit gamma n=1 Tax=Endozoicomonas sp. OPT23 TaxID=2072845 RepID=UPI00129A9165|nr:formate dehydrogenase subunit gamma [Endozoicomonas sp. OPT23]MRI33150.1 formate dehydrogenase subunit gamma [Endozoicomonas sp. OPT23]
MTGMTEDSSIITTVIKSWHDRPGALLPILHGIQDKLGYIPSEAIDLIASALRQTKAEIHGVISFYHHFRTTPPGNHQVQVCRAEACQARGSRSLEAHIKKKLSVDYHQTTMDKEFSLDAVYCLGNCACGPNIRISNEIHGRVSNERFDELVDAMTTRPLELQ